MTKRELLHARLTMYLQAEHDIVTHGQSVEVEGMKLTRASLDGIRKEIRNIKAELAATERKALSRSKRLHIGIPT